MRPERTTKPIACAHCGETFDSAYGARKKFCRRACYLASRGTVESRFWARVDRNGPVPSHQPELGPCWVWTGAKSRKSGYGSIDVDGKSERTHRLAWKLEHGQIVGGLWVLHHCDHRPCVRVSHLYLGTVKDNTQDMVDRHRTTTGDRNGSRLHPESLHRGEQSHLAKLTGDAVRSIRRQYADGNSLRALGRLYGVSDETISHVVKRRTWKHIEDGPHV